MNNKLSALFNRFKPGLENKALDRGLNRNSVRIAIAGAVLGTLGCALEATEFWRPDPGAFTQDVYRLRCLAEQRPLSGREADLEQVCLKLGPKSCAEAQADPSKLSPLAEQARAKPSRPEYVQRLERALAKVWLVPEDRQRPVFEELR